MTEPRTVHKDLFQYQKQGALFLARRKTALLADEQGTGKSAQTIAACDALGLTNILIICPGIARWNWENEIRLWSTVGRKVQVVESSKPRLWGEVVVISYSLIGSIPALKKILARHWDVVVCDESHFTKEMTSRRSRALYGQHFDGKTGIVSKSNRVWLLSGTIMPNHPGELWTHCHALFPDVARDPQNPASIMGKERWEAEYCVKNQGTNHVVASRNREQLATRLKPHVLRRTQVQVLPQLPPLRYSHIPVHPDSLPPMSTEVKETAAIVQAAIETMENPREANRGKVMLAQVDQGHMASLRRWTGLAKAPAVAEYIRTDLDTGMDRIVIFAWHRDVMAFLGDYLPDSAILQGGMTPRQKDEVLQEFKNGSSIRALICNMQVASTAINLVNANNVAFAEPSWVPSDHLQATARLHRQGQKRPVFARLFSLQGSFDEIVLNVLTRKLRDTTAFNRNITTPM